MDLFVVCSFDALPNKRAASMVLERRAAGGGTEPWPIILIRWGRHLVGYENRCPHQDTHLDWERGQFFDTTGTRLQCGKHGAIFDLATGECVEGPCAGASLTPLALVRDGDDVCIAGDGLVQAPDSER